MMLAEIREQPAALRRLLEHEEEVRRRLDFDGSAVLAPSALRPPNLTKITRVH
jgi:hypothetical protein